RHGEGYRMVAPVTVREAMVPPAELLRTLSGSPTLPASTLESPSRVALPDPLLREAEPRPASLQHRLDVQPQTGAPVALLYMRHVEPDAQVLTHLEAQLSAHGYRVFIDRHLVVGVEWAKEVEQQVRSAAAVIPLLSAASVQSEMLAYEVEMAHDAAQRQAGQPRLLPVRLNFTGRLPEALARILDPLQAFCWEGPQDTQRLGLAVLQALQH